MSLSLSHWFLALRRCPVAHLSRLGLRPLRIVATFQGARACRERRPAAHHSWLATRFFKFGGQIDATVIETERLGTGRYAARPPGR